MKKSLFIAVEGGEGSEKSTFMEMVRKELGDFVMTTREPGGSQYAEAIRDIALKNPLAKSAPAETMLCLMFGARFDHLKNFIIPTLDSGKHVITDRFDASSYAYQIYAQENLSLKDLFWKLRSHIRPPDIYIYIDVEAEEGLRRARARNAIGNDGNHFDDREVDFHKRLRVGYEEFFKHEGVKMIRINANQSLDKVKKDFMLKLSI